MRKILLTGAAGFIGFHVSRTLLADGDVVVGLDNLNDYYDVTLKHSRLEILKKQPNFTFIQGDLEDRALIRNTVEHGGFDRVINLAAQAGVRYSLTNPEAYIGSNLVGFFNIIDACKEFSVKHFLYASSSSVYGTNTQLPFSEADQVDTPVSLYAATKKSNELVAHSYSHMFGLPTTGFRFFTVYGPYGRPDMALFKFTKNMLEGKPIDVYNNGEMQRDFTYIDDIVQGIIGLASDEYIAGVATDKNNSGKTPYNIYNIGNSSPVNLMEFIKEIENELGLKADINFMPMQPGDVPATYADITNIVKSTGYVPRSDIKAGIKEFIRWYREYYGE